MDLKEIKKLISLMNENGLTRLEVEEEGRRYLLEKGTCGQGYLTPMPSMPFHGAFPPVGAGPVFDASPRAAGRGGSQVPEDTKTFNSPMVGTFYRAATPDAEAFVKPNDRVTPDTTICLIEAMKVFNEIKADMNGVVVEVLAENQEAVEYNQPLFLIKPI